MDADNRARCVSEMSGEAQFNTLRYLAWRPHGDSNPGLESRWLLKTTYIDGERDMYFCVIPDHLRYSHSHLNVSIARQVHGG